MTNEQIVEQIRAGKSVRDNMQLLYESNIGLIRRYILPYLAYDDLEDLLQQAYFGLWEAVHHYDDSRNVLFMSFAKYWIIQAVVRYIEECGSVIRIPSHIRQKIIKYKKYLDGFRMEHGRDPTDAETAKALKISLNLLEVIKNNSKSIISTDAPLNEDSEYTIGDTLQADFDIESDTVDKIYTEQSKSALWGIVESYMSTREADILKDRYIIRKSLSKIADEQNISYQRVRDIEHQAIRKLKIRAGRELQERLEVVESGLYRGNLKNYKEHGTSMVEYIAIKSGEIIEDYTG